MGKTKKQLIKRRDKLLKKLNKENYKISLVEKKLDKIRRHKTFKKHKRFIGNCYRLEYKFDSVQGIKMIQVLDICKKQPDYAKCKVLYKEGTTINVEIDSIELWGYTLDGILNTDNPDCGLGNSKEITVEEFNKFEKELLRKIKENKLKKDKENE